MKVGTLCYATEQGLGILAKSFYDAGVVTDPMVVLHAHWVSHMEWYPEAPSTKIKPFNFDRAVDHLRRCDVVLFFETPFNWKLIPALRSHGVRVVLMPMYECMPKKLPYVPDFYINPSALDQQYYPDNSVHLPVPVEQYVIDGWRLRERAEVFVHNAGRGGLRSRNGTGELLDAMKHVTSPIRLILRTQKKLQWDVSGDDRIEYFIGSLPHEKLWEEGDVFLFPEKFNGLSLPLQEAYASGMLVMTSDRFPNREYLPQAPLLPVDGYEWASIGGNYNRFQEAILSPQRIAETIDRWYREDIRDYSEKGKEWAESMSWKALRDRYLEVLRG